MYKPFVFLALLVTLPLSLPAQVQDKAKAVLAFYDDETQLSITDGQGNPVTPTEGMELSVNTIVKTLKTTAEIQLVPNGSIIKLTEGTTFAINGLRDGGTGSNDFGLIRGKIRAVAAKLAGGVAGYNISTPTANCGVRGTDFVMLYDLATQKDWVCVEEGQVEFTNISTGVTIPVGMGQFANTFDPVFQASAVDASRLAQLFSDVSFVKLKPADVPGQAVAASGQRAQPETPPTVADAKPSGTPADDPWLDALRSFLTLEVGSTTIDGTMYSKAVLVPVFTVDKFKMGLYLPIIYTNDLLDRPTWYRPGGNDEWSFGTDQHGSSRLEDFGADLALKLKFIQWGEQGTDPFYLKAGNLENVQLGHGTIVSGFANDQDYPEVRKIGVSAGAQLGPLAFEGLVDNVARPQVAGGRVALSVIGDQIVVGAQAAADFHLADTSAMEHDPALASMTATPSAFGDPVLVVGGADLQLFQIDFGPIFRIHLFGDVNTMTTYNRDAVAANGVTIGSGFQKASWWHDGKGNFGSESGIWGNLALMDYRLTFQTEQGLYRNELFQNGYYRNRNQLLMSMYDYESSQAVRDAADKTVTLGIYGALGFNLFGLLTLDGAYRWPFDYRPDGSVSSSDKDYLKVGLEIPKGKLPFVKLYGGVAYERSGFYAAWRDGSNLFNAAAMMSGNLGYGLTDGLDLVLTVSMSTVYDTAGNAMYDDTGKPKVAPIISLDTRLSL